MSLVFAAIAPHGTLPEAPIDNADATHAALAASRFGAQPSLPTAAEVDAILRA